jgi:prepilin-type N-terminal cleavage/methylation domain-containing protein
MKGDIFMKKSLRSNKGFSMVELIVVISVIAVLAVLSSVAYRNVQINARRAALQADVTALAGILNSHNTYATTPILTAAQVTAIDPGSATVNVTTPARGATGPQTFTVHLESPARRTIVESFLTAPAAGQTYWRVNTANIGTYNGPW